MHVEGSTLVKSSSIQLLMYAKDGLLYLLTHWQMFIVKRGQK